MSEHNGGSLEQALENLRSISGEVRSCAVLAADGELLASTYGEGVEKDRVRAMLEALASLSERTAAEEGKLHADRVTVKGEGGYVLSQRLKDGGNLFVTTGMGARTGLVLYDMKNSAAEIDKILEEGGR